MSSIVLLVVHHMHAWEAWGLDVNWDKVYDPDLTHGHKLNHDVKDGWLMDCEKFIELLYNYHETSPNFYIWIWNNFELDYRQHFLAESFKSSSSQQLDRLVRSHLEYHTWTSHMPNISLNIITNFILQLALLKPSNDF